MFIYFVNSEKSCIFVVRKRNNNINIRTMNNKEFYNYLLTNQKEFGECHNIYRGDDIYKTIFRFGYPFKNLGFDAENGWTKLVKKSGWQTVSEMDIDVIKCRDKFSLPAYTPDEDQREAYIAKVQKVRESVARKQELTEKHTKDWKKIKGQNPIPATIENIEIILRHFHDLDTVSKEPWPFLSVGYTHDEYDCGGKKVIAIKLDEPIQYEEGRMSSKFAYNAPVGYLTQYVNIR